MFLFNAMESNSKKSHPSARACKTLRKVFLSVLFLFTVAGLEAQATITWWGDSSAEWNQDNNWTFIGGGSVPGPLDTAEIKNHLRLPYPVISSLVPNIANLNLTGTEAELTIAANGSLTVNEDVTTSNGGSLTVNGDVTNTGTITIANGGSLTVNGVLTNTGTITIANGGSLTVNGVLTNTGTIDDNGTLNINGTLSNTGTLDGDANGTINITSVNAVTLAGTINTQGKIIREATSGTTGATTINTNIMAGEIFFGGIVTLARDTVITTTGNITFDSSIEGAYALKLNSLGKVTLNGNAWGIGSLDISANGGIELKGHIQVTNGDAIFNNNVTLPNEVHINASSHNVIFHGTITGSGKLQLITGGLVEFKDTVSLSPLIFTGNGNTTLTSGSFLSAVDLYLNQNGGTITLGSSLTCKNFYFYGGTLNPDSNNITTIKTPTTSPSDGNFVVFGTAYNSNDGGWAGNDTRHAYFGASDLALQPVVGNASFGSLIDTVTVGGNFYNNGANMADFDLNVPANGNNQVTNTTGNVTEKQWGTPYAVAFNMIVGDFIQIGGPVAAATGVTGQNVTNNGSSNEWYFDRPELVEAYTVSDNIIFIKFDMLIENSNNEIRKVFDRQKNNKNRGGVWYDSGDIQLIGEVYSDAACTTLLPSTAGSTEFYIKTDSTWNTDATGTSSDIYSTDKNGIERSNITTDLSFLKGMFYAAGGKTMSRAYGVKNVSGEGSFTGTTDKCPPVLISIETGRDSNTHNSGNPNTSYNWHNYFQIRYSEPVNIGSASIINTPLVNVRATESYLGATEYGGHLKETGSVVTMTGFFTYPGTFKSGLAGNPISDSPVNSIYRGVTTTPSNLNQYGYCGIRIYAAGYSTGILPKWVGYMSGVTDPKGKTATIISRNDIEDVAGNQLDFSSPITTVIKENPTSPADWEPPVIGPSKPDNYEGREVVQIDNNRDDIIDRFEIHILDNVDGKTWDALEDNPEDGGTDTFNKGKGLRENSFFPGSDKSYGFKIEEYGKSPVVPSGGFDFETSVFDPIFTGGGNPLTSHNDSYFSLIFNGDALRLDVRTTVIFSYNSNVGWATDLAGNLLQSVLPYANAMSVSPPIFTYTIGSVGSNKVYSKFSKAVYNQSNRANPFEPEDFSVIGTGRPNYYTIEKVIPITTENSGGEVGIDDAFFILNRPIEASDFLSIKFKPTFDALAEKSGIHMVDIHNVSDFAIGLIEPLWASDAYSNMANSGASIRNFTGNDKLAPADITLEATITTPSSPLPVSMYFDADVPDSVKVGNFWLPTLLPGYNTHPNIEARGLLAFQSKESLRDFLVPGGDSEIKSGNKIEFIFTVAGRYAGRLLDPDDPRSVAPWTISLQSTKQRDGVTILNNVINISRGEKTVLMLDTKKNSVFTINIFSLSGNVVKQLHKGSLPAGNYNFIWDGTNIGGRKVARGIYFIRVVGPDVDEYRKVIVAKD